MPIRCPLSSIHVLSAKFHTDRFTSLLADVLTYPYEHLRQAEGNELRNLAAEVSKCVTKQEMQQTVTAQVRPVVTAISSLEKVIQIQEDRRSTSALNAHTPVAPKQPVWNYDKIQSVVEDVLQQRYPHINESVTNRSLETSLAQHKEFLLHEMGSQVESVRLELAAAQRESVGESTQELDSIE